MTFKNYLIEKAIASGHLISVPKGLAKGPDGTMSVPKGLAKGPDGTKGFFLKRTIMWEERLMVDMAYLAREGNVLNLIGEKRGK